MSDKREWFYPAGDGSESVGPLTTEQLAEKLRSGELRVDDYIWGSHFADQEYRRIFELEELRPHLPVRQAPKPRMAPPVRVQKVDDEEATLVDNPVQREKDHPAIGAETSSPGFVKALAEAPAAPVPVEPEKAPEIVRAVEVPQAPLSIQDADSAKVAITVSEIPAAEIHNPRTIEAPTEDFNSEIERTNPSILFTRPEPSHEPPPPSGVREMSLDAFLAKTEPAPTTAAPPAAPPAPPAPIAVAPPPAPAPVVPPPAPPPAPPVDVAPPPIPALPPLEDTGFTVRPSSSENTVLTQAPPDLVTQPLAPEAQLEQTLLTQPTPTQSMPVTQPLPVQQAPEPVPMAAPPTMAAQDTVIIQRGIPAASEAPVAPPALADDKTIPSVETLLGHVRAEEPKAPEPAPPPPVTTVTPEPVTTINFTPILEEPVTSNTPTQPTAPMQQARPVSPVQPTEPVQPTQELRPQTQTHLKSPTPGATHMGTGRVAGTGSHMSTRSGNTNFSGNGQSRFTPKQDAYHAPQTDDFKATHDEPGEYGSENAYRRYPRVPFNTEVIMRDDREYHRFRSIDISEKGVRVKVDDISMFNKGEEITITVRGAPGIGTFSCKGVVMRILRADEGPGYGIFFMQLNPNIRRRITQFVLDQMSARLNRSATRGGPAAA